MKWLYRRWCVEKYNTVTGQTIPTEPPEARRLFWTEGGAVSEEHRLNVALMRVPSRWKYRFRVVRVYR